MSDLPRPESLEERLRRLAGMIPGYQGYMDRDARRNADKGLRDRVAQRLGDGLGHLTDLAGRLSRELKLDNLGEVDRLVGKVRATQARVEHADYGFSGLFDTTHIGEQQLAAVYEHDLGLLQSAEAVVAGAAAVANAPEDQTRAALSALDAALSAFESALRAREYVLEGSQGTP
jgi:hypothetical protein